MNIASLSDKYQVLKITANDIDSILSLCNKNKMYYKFCPPNACRESIIKDLKALPPGKKHKDKYYIGFFEHKKLIAVMDLILKYPNDETAYIGFFMMNSELQGMGIGTSIINGCCEYLKIIKFTKARLGYVKGNNQAKSFWQKNKFIPIGAEVKQELYTVVVMEKEL